MTVTAVCRLSNFHSHLSRPSSNARHVLLCLTPKCVPLRHLPARRGLNAWGRRPRAPALPSPRCLSPAGPPQTPLAHSGPQTPALEVSKILLEVLVHGIPWARPAASGSMRPARHPGHPADPWERQPGWVGQLRRCGPKAGWGDSKWEPGPIPSTAHTGFAYFKFLIFT